MYSHLIWFYNTITIAKPTKQGATHTDKESLVNTNIEGKQ